MHSFERLRYIARATGGDPALVAEEAAAALMEVGREPRALVMTCKRLLEFHAESAPMWWVVARVLGAIDPVQAAYESAVALASDETFLEVAVAISSQAVVVAPATQLCVSVISERPDLTCRLVGPPNALRRMLSNFDETATGYLNEDLDDALSGATCVLVEARAASSTELFFDESEFRLATAAKDKGVDVLVGLSEGRLLPDVLFGHVVSASKSRLPVGRDPEYWLDLDASDYFPTSFGDGGQPIVCHASLVTKVVTARGIRPWRLALSAVNCPVPSELVDWKTSRNQ